MWTQKHVSEAMRRTYELAARAADDGQFARAERIGNDAAKVCSSRSAYRLNLLSFAYLSRSEADRELDRIDRLADGRLVREHGWTVERIWFSDRYDAIDYARKRVKSVRRAVRVVKASIGKVLLNGVL